MRVELIEISNTWKRIKQAAFNTIGKDTDTEPSSEWKRKMLLAEHSPIRKLHLSWRWHDLKSWVSVHIVRHWLGIEHFVSTQRTDRTGIDRNELKQSELVKHECEVNAQAIITTSRKRLCKMASPETQEAWKAFLESFKELEPELYSACVPDCIYRGHCFEYKTCGFHNTGSYQERLAEYRKGINQPEVKVCL